MQAQTAKPAMPKSVKLFTIRRKLPYGSLRFVVWLAPATQERAVSHTDYEFNPYIVLQMYWTGPCLPNPSNLQSIYHGSTWRRLQVNNETCLFNEQAWQIQRSLEKTIKSVRFTIEDVIRYAQKWEGDHLYAKRTIRNRFHQYLSDARAYFSKPRAS